MTQDNLPANESGSQAQNQPFPLVKAVKFFAQAATDVTKEATKAITDASRETNKTISDTTQEVAKAVIDAAQGTAKVVSDVSDVVQEASKLAVNVTQQTTRTVTDTATEIAKSTTDVYQKTTKEMVDYNKNKLEAGQMAKEASILAHINQISSDKAAQLEKTIVELKEKHCTEETAGLFKRLLFYNITKVTAISGALRLVPGKIPESMGLDQTTLILLEIETIYQIAAIYGFNLELSERKEEVFAILDRALRASRTTRRYLNYTEIIPYAGGVLNAGTDGYELSLVANTAYTFYELQFQEAIQGETLSSFVEETKKQFERLW